MTNSILTITSEQNNGKGKENMIKFDTKFYIYELLNKKLLNSINFSNYNILICDYNEDSIRATGLAKKYFKTLENMLLFYEQICENALKQNPLLRIYQQPSKCSWIGNKEKTYQMLKTIINNEDVFAIPTISTINNEDDLSSITSFPIILKTVINTGKERKLDCIVKSLKHAKQKYREFFIKYKEIIAVQYINSRIIHLKCNHFLRLFIINDSLIDWSIRPSSDWNIHSQNTITKKSQSAEDYINPIINEHMEKINYFIKKMYDILGEGFYAWDVIYNKEKNKFFICELGLKYFDYFMANRVKGQFTKLCMDKKHMTKVYNDLFGR